MISGGLFWALVGIGISFWLGATWGAAREKVNAHLAELRRSDARVQRGER